MKGIIFIHGFNKTSNDFNKTEQGKDINIEKQIGKRNHTILIQIDNYMDVDTNMKNIIEKLKKYNVKEWILVCHSLAIIYCLQLLKYNIFSGVCLIDPTVLDDISIKEYNINMDNYIKVNDISTKIVFHIHLNYDEKDLEYFSRQVKYYSKFIGKNDKSKMIIHPNKSHMLHYTDSPKILRSILDLI